MHAVPHLCLSAACHCHGIALPAGAAEGARAVFSTAAGAQQHRSRAGGPDRAVHRACGRARAAPGRLPARRARARAAPGARAARLAAVAGAPSRCMYTLRAWHAPLFPFALACPAAIAVPLSHFIPLVHGMRVSSSAVLSVCWCVRLGDPAKNPSSCCVGLCGCQVGRQGELRKQ